MEIGEGCSKGASNMPPSCLKDDLSKELLKPKEGMEFDSLDEAESFYNSYAKNYGFSVRKGGTLKRKDTSEVYSKRFLCSKEGAKVLKLHPGERQRTRGESRENCNAHIRVQRIDLNGKWKIVKFVEQHSHDIASPSKTYYLRSHRNVTEAARCLIDDFGKSNISTDKIMSMLATFFSRVENVGCIEKDIRNHIGKTRLELRGYDAQVFMDHLKDNQEHNESYFFESRIDEESRLTDVFWSDGWSRKAYHHFGDVLVFYATYDTNEYSMIMTPFVGVNHHGQSIVFGCGLISNENAETYKWLFQTFLKSVSGRMPKTIVTDQDPAMAAAISSEFPSVPHLLCMWHILQKLPNKISDVHVGDEMWMDCFKNCVWNSFSKERFEVEWHEVLKAKGLESNEWLQYLFHIRQNWIPVYFKDTFLAGIRTTQRSESMNSFFEKFVSKKMSLREFIVAYDSAIRRMRDRENKADHDTRNERPKLVTPYQIEEQIADIYTKSMFFKFQKKLKGSEFWGSRPVRAEGEWEWFTTKLLSKVDENMKKKISLVEEVRYKASNNEAYCSCKKFESTGIVCSHILSVLKCNGIQALPDLYICERWTRRATKSTVTDSDGQELRADEARVVPNTDVEIFKASMDLMSEARKSEEHRSAVLEGMLSLKKSVSEIPLPSSKTTSKRQISIPEEIEFHEPLHVNAKGSEKRIKRAKEKAIEKSKKERMCHGCKKQGVMHDKRNCPVLKLRGSVTINESQASINFEK